MKQTYQQQTLSVMEANLKVRIIQLQNRVWALQALQQLSKLKQEQL